jgi:hypothetical protein
MPSSPYVVRTSDYLTALALRRRTTVDVILADPKNAVLKKGHPEILAPGTIVYLPEVPLVWIKLNVGTVNTFTVDVPTIDVHVILLDEEGSPIAGKRVTTDPIVSDTPLSTDGSGRLTLSVGIDVSVVEVAVDGTTLRFRLRVGNLDPCDTDRGLASRLRHLGHLGDEDDVAAARPWLSGLLEGVSDQTLALGVASFQQANGQDPTGDASNDVRKAIQDKHGC